MDDAENVTTTGGSAAHLTQSQRRWLEHIQRCEGEGLPFSRYCTRERLNVKALYAAREALQSKGLVAAPKTSRSPRRFVPVRVSRPVAHVPTELVLPNGFGIRVTCTDVEQVARLVYALGRL
jgi:hypothetical protein